MIEIKGLSFNYENEQKALNDINLTVNKGEVICLTGASGCGKTTLTRILNGAIPHFFKGHIEGEIIINNKDMKDQSIYDVSKESGSVFQNPRSQFFCLNTTSELAFEPENYGVNPTQIKSDIGYSAYQFNLEHLLDRGIFSLSGGEKQLIACTAIQVSGHALIILDEPSSNLDFKTITRLKSMIELWKSTGKTIVIAEHRLHYLIDVVDRFIVMEQGTIKKRYDNYTFNTLSLETLTSLGLRHTHLTHMKPKRVKSESTTYLNLHNFYFRYKAKQPLALNIDKLKLPKGEVTALIGYNGSGKSTFARCLTGLERKFKGKVNNEKSVLTRNQRLNHVYMVLQDVNNQLFAENVEEELRLSNDQLSDEAIKGCLTRYGIASHIERHPLALSGGEKQRLAIASAVESQRDVLIFDEPSSGLDGKRMREMSEIINDLAQQGHTIIVITHDYELLLSCADEVLQLEAGSVVSQYRLDEYNLEKLQTFFEIEKPSDE